MKYLPRLTQGNVVNRLSPFSSTVRSPTTSGPGISPFSVVDFNPVIILRENEGRRNDDVARMRLRSIIIRIITEERRKWELVFSGGWKK